MASVNLFSTPCSLISSLVTMALAIIGWSSYGMGVTVGDRGRPEYLGSAWWMSIGCFMATLAVAIIKFVD